MLDYYHQKIADGLIDPPEDTPEMLEEYQQIWDYVPLVRRCADQIKQYSNISYQDQCQQGYLLLADLTAKIDWQSDRNGISKYVSLIVRGRMKDFVAHNEHVVKVPNFTADYFDFPIVSSAFNEDYFPEDVDNPEEELILKERRDQLRNAVTVIIPSLNEREFYVLFNCMLDDRSNYRQAAEEFTCSKSSIERDIVRVKAKLKEVLDDL